MYYINRVFLYSQKNIAGYEILDYENTDFRLLLQVDEAIDFIKSQNGKIFNAKLNKKGIDEFGRHIYEIEADGENCTELMDRDKIFNLAAIFNERAKYYQQYQEYFLKYLCIANF